ncbi:tyrosine-type recombinase/integrase [Thomasclavelia cocleata]|uniref:tyrosine-type recombinase/integrase n=1 Tax=Thomasclavelia cocleata TaxID=69824 RepID=UPI0025706268|nr:site-specific integrase [Thomasclavelia cocleata]
MPRRGENIHKRKDGRWEARYIKDRKNGKAVYHSVYAKTYSEVKAKLKACITKEKDSKIGKGSKKMTFDDVFQEWLRYKQNFIKQSSYNKYFNLYGSYISDVLKDTYLDEISNSTLQKAVISIMNLKNRRTKQKLSTSTVRGIVYVIKCVILFAQKQGYIKAFCLQIDIPSNETKSIRALTREEQSTLEFHTRLKLDTISLAVLICLYTGLRIGEVCALRWEDIDLNNKYIVVNKTVQRIQQHHVPYRASKTVLITTPPKTNKAIRKIPISSVLYPILNEYREQNYHGNKHYVLVNKNDDMIDPCSIQYKFKELIKKLKITPVTFHGLRHTFATRCIEVGMDIKTLSEILGHSNVSTTMSIYVHSTEQQKKNQIELLSQL